jgi:dTDP-glucose pyrophosphorylase
VAEVPLIVRLKPIPPLAYVLGMSINPQERGLADVPVGGQGTRLRPLTEQTPKPMLPILGRPLLAYTFDQLKAGGVERAILSCGYLPDEITEYFGDNFDGLELEYRVEPEPRGTDGGLRFGADAIAETFVALNVEHAVVLPGGVVPRCAVVAHAIISSHALVGSM